MLNLLDLDPNLKIFTDMLWTLCLSMIYSTKIVMIVATLLRASLKLDQTAHSTLVAIVS